MKISSVFNALLPPRCASCQKIVLDDKTLCEECWPQINFITAPFCKICGLPFEIDVPDQAICLTCARKHPPFHQARAVMAYDDFSKDMILGFKHGDRCDFAPIFAGWMARCVQDILEDGDIIMPVPLHPKRLAKRRYNQAALLSREMSKLTGLKSELNTLRRCKNTKSQGHLSRMARQKNLQGAFDVQGDLSGKRVLLVDDVLTTGATLVGCATALMRAGASEVRICTLARVLQT